MTRSVRGRHTRSAIPWQPYHTVWALLVFGWIGNYMIRMALSPLLDPVMAEVMPAFKA